MREDYLSGGSEGLSAADRELEITLRPQSFGDFAGQRKVVENISIFV
jgi:Holliday junction DNA helicase RuvB